MTGANGGSPFLNLLNFRFTACIFADQTGTWHLGGDGYYLSDMSNMVFAAAGHDGYWLMWAR